MNKLAFLEELLAVCSFAPLIKRANTENVSNASDIPTGMMDQGPTPPYDRVKPDEAATRLPATASVAPTIIPGQLGAVTEARWPIDRKRFNRAYNSTGYYR